MLKSVKLKLILSTILMGLIVIGTSVFTIINNVNRVEEKEIEYSTEWSSDDEYHWHRAIDASITSVKDKAAHTYGEWYIDKEASDYEDGIETKKCSICNHEMHRSIPFKSVINYKLNDDNTYTVLSVKENELESITVPSTVNNIPVKYILEDAFNGCVKLKTITLGENIISIGKDAFKEAVNLTKVNYLGNITNWCKIEFENEYSNPVGITKNFFIKDVLQISIDLPKSITSIGKYTFYGFEGITSVHYKSNINDWCKIDFYHEYSNPLCYGASLYFNDIKASTIQIPDAVTEIKNYAFYGSSLTEVAISNKVTKIGAYTFYNNKNLGTITLGDTTSSNMIKEIGEYAFAANDALEILNLPTNLEILGDYAFTNSSKLITVNFNSTLTTISKGAFSNCPKLSNLSLPQDLVEIKNEAFYNCTSLPELILTINVKKIGDYAFYNNTALKSVNFPSVFEELGEYAFAKCASLEALTLTDTKLQVVTDHAFDSCYSLAEVTLGESITKIGKYAFNECSSINEITFPVNLTEIDTYAFYNNTSLTIVKLNENLTTIKEFAFLGCVKLLEIYNYSNIELVMGSEDNGFVAYYALIIHTSDEESIIIKQGDYNFIYLNNKGYILDYLGSEASIILPSSFIYDNENIEVYGIYDNAFKNKTNLISIKLPTTCKEINNDAFNGCTSLRSIDLGNALEIIGERAFLGSTSLTSISLPTTLKEIKAEAFKDCYRLLEVYNLSSLSITFASLDNGYAGFYALAIKDNPLAVSSVHIEKQFIFFVTSNESFLIGYNGTDKNIAIPNTFVYYGVIYSNFNIYKKAFYNMDIESVIIPEGVEVIYESAFEGSLIKVINLPLTLDVVADNAFKDCINLETVNYAGSIENRDDIAAGDNNEWLYRAIWNYGIKTEEFEEEWTYDNEFHWHKSKDKDSLNVKDKDYHSISDWEVDEFPDEEGIYYQTGTCSICGNTITVIHNHTYEEEFEYDDESHWRKATCRHTDLIADSGEHEYGEWRVVVEATIDHDGYKEKECLICGYKVTEIIYQLDHEHTYSDVWSHDANFHWHDATCVHEYPTGDIRKDLEPHTVKHIVEHDPRNDGNYYEVDYCTVCGYIILETIHVHTTDNPTEYEAKDKDVHYNIPNCVDENGNKIHQEARANPAEHSYTDWEYYEVEGVKYQTRTCVVCGYVVNEVVDEESEHVGPEPDPANPQPQPHD